MLISPSPKLISKAHLQSSLAHQDPEIQVRRNPTESMTFFGTIKLFELNYLSEVYIFDNLGKAEDIIRRPRDAARIQEISNVFIDEMTTLTWR